eukprot:Nk52_evm37s207 gene=Nk52_evmTU37s207
MFGSVSNNTLTEVVVSCVVVFLVFAGLLYRHIKNSKSGKHVVRREQDDLMARAFYLHNPPLPATSSGNGGFVGSPERRDSLVMELSSFATPLIRSGVKITASIVNFVKAGPRSVHSRSPVFALSASQNGIAYYEIKISACDKGVQMTVGFSSIPYAPFRMTGFDRYSVGVQSGTGAMLVNDENFGMIECFGEGDIVGCGASAPGIDGMQHFFFTKNGVRMSSESDLCSKDLIGRTFANISATGNCCMELNFGERPFEYQLDRDEYSMTEGFIPRALLGVVMYPREMIQIDVGVTEGSENESLPPYSPTPSYRSEYFADMFISTQSGNNDVSGAGAREVESAGESCERGALSVEGTEGAENENLEEGESAMDAANSVDDANAFHIVEFPLYNREPPHYQ